MKLPTEADFIYAVQHELAAAFEKHGFAQLNRLAVRYFEEDTPISAPTMQRIMLFDPTIERPRFFLHTLYDAYDFARWARKQ